MPASPWPVASGVSAEEFQFIDVNDQFPGDGAISFLKAFGLRATAEQDFHAYGNMFSQLLSSTGAGVAAFTRSQ